jgi:hypothetical protein
MHMPSPTEMYADSARGGILKIGETLADVDSDLKDSYGRIPELTKPWNLATWRSEALMMKRGWSKT